MTTQDQLDDDDYAGWLARGSGAPRACPNDLTGARRAAWYHGWDAAHRELTGD